MSEKLTSSPLFSPYAAGVAAILAAGVPCVLLVYKVAGPIVAAAAGIILGASLCLAFLRRGEAASSRDPHTGLPDRAFAIERLGEIMNDSAAGHADAALIVVSLKFDDGGLEEEERRGLAVLTAARMAHRLRRGDQIVRVGETSLGAILAPSLGITAQSAERILDRIDAMFGDTVRIGDRTVEARAAVGACLRHDAPGTTPETWLAAAERAADMAAAEGHPRLFPSGAMSVDCVFGPRSDRPADPRSAEANWAADSDADRRAASVRRSA